MADSPSVGVVLVNLNGARFLNDCIRCLKAGRYPQLEIVIVDNGSTDESVERVHLDHPDVTVLRQRENLGFAGGSNVGIRHALERGHEYVLLLNNDTRPDQSLVTELVAVADARTLVAPRSYNWEGTALNSHVGHIDWRRGRLAERFWGKQDVEASRSLQEVELADGACLLVPVSVFREIGVLDEAYFLYYEDWDFVVRARRAGCRILYQPAATLRHYERGTTGRSAEISPITAYYTTRNRLRFMQKQAPTAWSYRTFVVYFSVTRSLTALRFLFRGKAHLAVCMLQGVRDFLRGRTGPAPMHLRHGSDRQARAAST